MVPDHCEKKFLRTSRSRTTQSNANSIIVVPDTDDENGPVESKDDDGEWRPKNGWKPEDACQEAASPQRMQQETIHHPIELVERQSPLGPTPQNLEKASQQPPKARKKRGNSRLKSSNDATTHHMTQHSMQKEIDRITNECEVKIAALTHSYSLAEKGYMAQIKSQTYISLPDNEVRDKFGHLLSRSNIWAKDWADTEHKIASIQSIKPVIEELVRDREHIKSAASDIKTSKSPKRLILFMELTRCWMNTCFSRPFFMFGCAGYPAETIESLESVYERFKQSDVKQAHIWRAETVRSIAKSFDYMQSSLTVDPDPEDAIEGSLQCMTKKFLNGKAIGRLRSLDGKAEQIDRRHTELLQLVKDAVWLAVHLWCQKSDMQFTPYRDIYEHPFSIASDLYKPYGSMGLDIDDETYNGQLIDLILAPGVCMYGDASGDYPKERKVLSPAVVIIFGDLHKGIVTSKDKKAAPSKPKLHKRSFERSDEQQEPVKRAKTESTEQHKMEKDLVDTSKLSNEGDASRPFTSTSSWHCADLRKSKRDNLQASIDSTEPEEANGSQHPRSGWFASKSVNRSDNSSRTRNQEQTLQVIPQDNQSSQVKQKGSTHADANNDIDPESYQTEKSPQNVMSGATTSEEKVESESGEDENIALDQAVQISPCQPAISQDEPTMLEHVKSASTGGASKTELAGREQTSECEERLQAQSEGGGSRQVPVRNFGAGEIATKVDTEEDSTKVQVDIDQDTRHAGDASLHIGYSYSYANIWQSTAPIDSPTASGLMTASLTNSEGKEDRIEDLPDA